MSYSSLKLAEYKPKIRFSWTLNNIFIVRKWVFMVNQPGRGGPGVLQTLIIYLFIYLFIYLSLQRNGWQWQESFHLQILTIWLFAVWLTVNRSRAVTLIRWSSRQKHWFPGSPSRFCSVPLFPAHYGFVKGGGGVYDSQRQKKLFVSFYRNFRWGHYLLFKKICKSVSDVIFQKGHCASKWLKQHASSETQQGCRRRGHYIWD